MADDAFDFYPCMVDKAPASIYVNLRFAHEPAPPGADTRSTLAIFLRDRGAHGIGTEAEADVIEPFEERALAAAAAAGLVFVGRVRHGGVWELTFYGAGEGARGARAALAELDASSLDGRRVTTTSQLDPSWRYYRELLLPDADRERWMDDRRLVEILRAQGDALVKPRRIDHRAVFTTVASRDAFLTEVERHGFQRDEAPAEEAEAPAFPARVWRVDPIELDHIHEVVMILVDAALARGGVYEGWTASIEA